MTQVADAPMPAAGDVSLAVVIPTCNRAALAIAACRSLLEQTGLHHEVFVSDNSTSAEEAQTLARFCRERNDPRLTYLRPQAPLTMPSHWDWALGQVMNRSTASHLAVHYDRKITKPGHLRLLADVAGRFPDRLLTYAVDHVSDQPVPSTLWQAPWTGRVYEMMTSRVLELTARCRIDDMGHAFPILSNCVIPRDVLLAVRERFGSICDSTGPDSCFTYRFCALYDRYLHLDCSTGVIYAAHRSNGLGYLRQGGGDFGQFKEAWGDRPWLDAAPIPGLNLGQNMLFHEYELVRRARGGERFPQIDRDAYLKVLEAALRWVEDPKLRAEMRAVLETHGLPVHAAGSIASAASETSTSPPPLSTSVAQRLVRMLRSRYRALRRRQSIVLFLAEYFRVRPEHITGFTFDSDIRALRFALMLPRRRDEENPYLVPLLPREVYRPSSFDDSASN